MSHSALAWRSFAMRAAPKTPLTQIRAPATSRICSGSAAPAKALPPASSTICGASTSPPGDERGAEDHQDVGGVADHPLGAGLVVRDGVDMTGSIVARKTDPATRLSSRIR